MRARIMSGPGAGILELQPSIHRHELSNLVHTTLSHPHQLQSLNVMTGLESDHPMGLMENKGPQMSCGKGKGIASSIIMNNINNNNYNINNNSNNNSSEEDEPSFTEDGNSRQFGGAKGKKDSPWQRMKWTDNMVRLLITVVSCVGDDGIAEGTDGLKRKSGVLQKKGKWKSVSSLMMERGCSVSPQQCEDKFNDLNKRYKRLNEILGRGTTCQVVEKPALLDSMPQLSAKMKDDVRKILSSKHLFYKEMCAYHNGQRIPNSHDLDLQGYSMPVAMHSKDSNDLDEDEDDDNEESDDDDDDLDNEEDNHEDKDAKRVDEFGKRRKLNENEHDVDFWQQSVSCDSFGTEMVDMLQDPTKSPWEQHEWIKNHVLQLQEQSVTLQVQSFELEKRRFKWQRFCCKKDRELERLRLDNERMKLENERMALQVKQKELDIDFRMAEVSLNHVSLGTDRRQEKDQI